MAPLASAVASCILVQKSQSPPGAAEGCPARGKVFSACSALELTAEEGLCWPEQAGEGHFFHVVGA